MSASSGVKEIEQGGEAQSRHCSNNDQLLDLIPLASIHPVPRRVRQRAADGPHDGDGGFERTWDVLAVLRS